LVPKVMIDILIKKGQLQLDWKDFRQDFPTKFK
jgi:hypothetical protein